MSFTLNNFLLNTQITSISATDRQLAYTASNGIAQIDQITVKNSNVSTAYDVFVYIVSDTTTTGTVVEIQKKNIAADTTVSFEMLIGHKVPSGGSIQVHSTSATDTYLTISGSERQQ